MNSWNKTLAFVGAAGLCVAAVYFTRPVAREVALISDQGEALAPLLTDPLAIKGLEVISFDASAAKTRAFSVRFEKNRWVIPSHNGYPADAADKVAEAASAFAGLVKERVVTDSKEAHAALGVLDPSDESATAAAPEALGTRVTLSDASRPIVDLIIGKPVASEAGGSPFQAPSTKRYVREAGKNRVYITTLEAGFSTKFADWVQTDLVQVTADQIESLVIDHYQVDPERGITRDPVSIELKRPAPAEPDPTQPTPPAPSWTLQATPGGGLAAGQVVNQARIDEALQTLVGLRIVGVRAKPANLAKALGGTGAEVSLTLPDQISLQSRGFYLGPSGQLLANEGQLGVRCADGVVYSLWFGGIVPDTEDAASGQVGGETEGTKGSETAKAPGDARYLMITVAFDPALVPEPVKPEALVAAEAAFAKLKAEFEAAKAQTPPASEPAPSPEGTPPASAAEPQPEASAPVEPPELVEMRSKHQADRSAWTERVERGKKRAEGLSRRFADWYYVIAADSLSKLRPKLDELVKPAEATATVPAPGASAPSGEPAGN
ncbi:MAG: DUF4340 domain-containing protein [Phycisphaerales bacterium]